MSSLEKGSFCLHHWHHILLFQGISDSLNRDWDRENRIDEFGGLHSIINLSRFNFIDQSPPIPIRKLGRSACFDVLFVWFNFRPDPLNSSLPNTHFLCNFPTRKTFQKQGNHSLVLFSGDEPHGERW